MQKRKTRGYDSYSVSYHRGFSTKHPPGMLAVDPVQLPPLRLTRGEHALQFHTDYRGNPVYFDRKSESDVSTRPDVHYDYRGSEERMDYRTLSDYKNLSYQVQTLAHARRLKLPPIKVQLQRMQQGHSYFSTDSISQSEESCETDQEDTDKILPDLPSSFVNNLSFKSYSVLPPIGHTNKPKKRIHNTTSDLTERVQGVRGKSQEVLDEGSYRLSKKRHGLTKSTSDLTGKVKTSDVPHLKSADDQILSFREIIQLEIDENSEADNDYRCLESKSISGKQNDEVDAKKAKTHTKNAVMKHEERPVEKEIINANISAHTPSSVQKDGNQENDKKGDNSINSDKLGDDLPKEVQKVSIPKDPNYMLQEIRSKMKVKLKLEDVEKIWDAEMLKWIKENGRRNAICAEMDPMYADLAVIVGHNLLIQHLEEICMF